MSDTRRCPKCRASAELIMSPPVLDADGREKWECAMCGHVGSPREWKPDSD